MEWERQINLSGERDRSGVTLKSLLAFLDRIGTNRLTHWVTEIASLTRGCHEIIAQLISSRRAMLHQFIEKKQNRLTHIVMSKHTH